MILENYGISHLPIFVTATYAPKHLPTNNHDCIKYCQRWMKRLRYKIDSPIRYFLVTEEGSKNGRLHQHLIMWIPSLADLDDMALWRILHGTWKGGILTCDRVRSLAGLGYVSKYITKNLSSTNGAGYTYSRYEGKWVKPGRLYTNSNRPRLGDAGLTRWEYLASEWVKQFDGFPPNHFNMFLFNKVEKVYIPGPAYCRFVKSLGLSFADYPKSIASDLTSPVKEAIFDALLHESGNREWHVDDTIVEDPQLNEYMSGLSTQLMLV